MNWFTSDLHLGHAKVIEFCNRPFVDVAGMDKFLLTNLLWHCKPMDTLYVLGDLSFHKYRDVLPLFQACNLMCRKVLIRGNHDKYSDAQYKALGFDVYEEMKLKVEGHYFKLSHYPYWDHEDQDVDKRYPERRPIDQGGYLLHGHVHTAWIQRARMINVGVDVWSYKPVSQTQIISLLNRGHSTQDNAPPLA